MLAVLFCLSAGTSQAGSPGVRYHLSFADRQNQYVDVTMDLPVDGAEVELVMPNWTPGSYLIREYAAQLERLKVSGADGKPLTVTKTSKNRWRVNCAGEHEIRASYSVWGGELAVNTVWVEKSFALINGAGVFLFSAASRDMPQSVSIALPQDWARIYTALPGEADSSEFTARNFDELVDSPMLIGNAPEHRFTVKGHDYVLVNQGENGLWDGARSAADVAKIVSAEQAFWAVDPLDRPYYFLNIIADGRGGLEHDYSTVLMADAWQMRYRDDYIRWLALVAHEFFHAWNVRRMRPQILHNYDYDHETYLRELWLAEGLTSYYDNLLLLRSGLITVEEYFTLLAREFHSYETTPGRRVRSAELASFDAWIKHYKQDANTINSTVSYYRKGAIIGFVTDMAIRRETGLKSSLDTLMREMYRLYGPRGEKSEGYPTGAFETLVESLAGKTARQRVEALIRRTEDPDIDGALAWYGLALDRAPSKDAAAAAGLPVPAGFGVLWDPESPQLLVQAVLKGGTGAEAGVLPGDELLAIDGFRVTRETLPDRMLHLAPGDKVDLLLVRHAKVMSLEAAVQEAIPDKYQITIEPDIKRRQKERMSSWLGVQLKFVNRAGASPGA